MRNQRGSMLVMLLLTLAIVATATVSVAAAVGQALDVLRAHGGVSSLYAAVHLTQTRARARGVMHALVIDPGGRTFRVIEDPSGAATTVAGPHALADGVAATANITIRFSPRGFAVPFGTITVRAGDVERRVIVNILGRVRVA